METWILIWIVAYSSSLRPIAYATSGSVEFTTIAACDQARAKLIEQGIDGLKAMCTKR